MPHNRDKMDPVAFGTFGAGPRACPGKMFAYECMIMFCAHLLSNFKFTTKPGIQIDYYPGTPSFSTMTELLFLNYYWMCQSENMNMKREENLIKKDIKLNFHLFSFVIGLNQCH